MLLEDELDVCRLLFSLLLQKPLALVLIFTGEHVESQLLNWTFYVFIITFY